MDGHRNRALASILFLGLACAAADCQFLGGAAFGAGATGAAYEYETKRALDELDRDFRAGRISRDEYLERKRDLEKRSVLR